VRGSALLAFALWAVAAALAFQPARRIETSIALSAPAGVIVFGFEEK